MCIGGRLLADFRAGTCEQPEVPDVVGECLTTTVDGHWVVWAHKVAKPDGDRFRPLVRGACYPADAVAECRAIFGRGSGRHAAPDPACTCGFHALSRPWFIQSAGAVCLEVALSGRILAYEWPQQGVLFRAERQTVMRVETAMELMPHSPAGLSSPPDGGNRDGGGGGNGGSGGVRELRRPTEPRGAGPMSRPLAPSLRILVCRM